jgi:hypothetical protein
VTTDELIEKLNAGAVGELYTAAARIRAVRKAALEVAARTRCKQLKALAEVDRASLNAQLRRMGDTVIALTTKNAEEKAVSRRLCGEQVVLVRALRALVNFCDQGIIFDGGAIPPAEMIPCLKEAKEVLALVEVPFSG